MTKLHNKINTFKEQHPFWHIVFKTCILFILACLVFLTIRTLMSWKLSLPAEIIHHLFPSTMLLLAVLIAYTAIKPTKTKACICLGLFTGLFFWPPPSDGLLKIGMQYATGFKLLEKNEEHAELCFRKAAELDEKTPIWYCYGRVGLAYSLGVDVEKNDIEAERWFRKARTICDGISLSLIYYRMAGFYIGWWGDNEQDAIEAERCLRKAAVEDSENYAYPDTLWRLGFAYATGLGEDKDETAADWCFRKYAEESATQKDVLAFAYYTVGLAYAKRGPIKNDVEAEKWFRKAGEISGVDYSFARCCYLTGKAYALGDGVEINTAEADKWFRKAAEEGDEFPLARSYRLMETEWNARDGADAKNESAKWKRKADEAELNSQS